MRPLVVLVAVISLLIATDAEAQQAPQASAPRTQQQSAARQCLSDINAFGERMDKDGFWLNGYGSRWGYGGPRSIVSPWGAVIGFGLNAPRVQIQTLFVAATVLARRGNELACQSVLAELGKVYGERVAQELCGILGDEAIRRRGLPARG
jgi:hypothetical protein